MSDLEQLICVGLKKSNCNYDETNYNFFNFNKKTPYLRNHFLYNLLIDFSSSNIFCEIKLTKQFNKKKKINICLSVKECTLTSKVLFKY